MNTQREDRKLKDASKEANKKTKTFVDAVRKDLMLAFENLRIMIDEEDILKQLKIKDLKQYHNECLKEDIDLDYKTVSSRLNVARMIHDFKHEGIEVPEKVEYTPLRTLTSAFNKHDNQRELQIRAWEVVTQKHKFPDNEDVVDAIEKVTSELCDTEVETSDDDCDNKKNLTPESSAKKEQNELIVAKKERIHEEELATKYYDQLPKEFQKLFGKNYRNDILLAMLSAIDDLANDDCETKTIKRRTDEAIEFFQNYITCLQEYNDDKETRNNITYDVYNYYYHKRREIIQNNKILKIRHNNKQINNGQ